MKQIVNWYERSMARVVGIRKSSVSIEHGHRSREKRIKVADCAKDTSDVLEILKSSVGNCSAVDSYCACANARVLPLSAEHEIENEKGASHKSR